MSRTRKNEIVNIDLSSEQILQSYQCYDYYAVS